MKLGLIGYPVKHSSSPRIQKQLGIDHGIEVEYELYEVAPENVKEFVDKAWREGFDGFNVTVPHKPEVMKYLVRISSEAKEVGAVNTCKRITDGFAGYNTDIKGFIRALQSEGIDVKGRKCVVLGAGGAARSIVYSLLSLDASQVCIVNRTKERALALKAQYDGKSEEDRVRVCEEEQILSEGERVIAIQATGLGLKEGDPSPVGNEAFYDLCDACYDLMPIERETAFMKEARKHGVRAYNGMKMLQYQAEEAFNIWINKEE